MKIIISPAKKMRRDPDSLPWQDLPAFLDKTEHLYGILKEMPYEVLKNLWKCNDQIAALKVVVLKGFAALGLAVKVHQFAVGIFKQIVVHWFSPFCLKTEQTHRQR